MDTEDTRFAEAMALARKMIAPAIAAVTLNAVMAALRYTEHRDRSRLKSEIREVSAIREGKFGRNR